jgi:predicted HAD superfamily Cof-like phosphohydrolase
MPEIQTDIEGPDHERPMDANPFTRHDRFRAMCGSKTVMCNPIFLVKDFQEKVLGIPFPRRPQVFSKKQVDETAEKLIEEVHEFLHSSTVADRADALVDLVYFALGGLHQMGVPTEIVFQKVHRRT